MIGSEIAYCIIQQYKYYTSATGKWLYGNHKQYILENYANFRKGYTSHDNNFLYGNYTKLSWEIWIDGYNNQFNEKHQTNHLQWAQASFVFYTSMLII